MKILVTGANGYIGQGVVNALLEHGHEIVAADLNIGNVKRDADARKCNIFDVENPFLYFGKPEMVIHLAWTDGCKHFSDSHIENLFSHYSFVKRICEGGIRKIVVTGSVHEVGMYEGAVDEETPCRPLSPYGISKNALRELTFWVAEQYDVSVQWLRRYYVVGNSGFGDTIFSKIVQAVKKGNGEFPLTRGIGKYDFLEYADFCKKFVLTVEQDCIDGIINICSGMPERLIDRVEQFIKENAYNIKLKIGAYPERQYDSMTIWGDAKKIRNIEDMSMKNAYTEEYKEYGKAKKQ